MKDIRLYLESKSSDYSKVDKIEDLYKVASNNGDKKKYPYAIDAIAYYIYGDKDKENIVSQILRGEYGHNDENKLEDESEISSLLMDYEFDWHEDGNISDIDGQIRNMKLKNGDKVEDVF